MNPSEKVTLLRQSSTIVDIIAHHVSAKELSFLDVSTLIQHKNLSPNDRTILTAAYREEYFGLKDFPAWFTITEQQYQQMKHKVGNPLPTMAISTINKNGSPKRAKYRIVVLGNLDNHHWAKSQTYTPVLNLVELRLITSLAIHHKRVLKSGDFKQAFCQAILPKDQQYVLSPPPGCPFTPPNTYWLLKRTLYVLKRSLKHWFDKATSILRSLGLEPMLNAPCVFKGEITPGRAPLYLGIYVDDFVYFSEDDEVEETFKTKLTNLTLVDFMGKVTHFLGIKFQWK